MVSFLMQSVASSVTLCLVAAFALYSYGYGAHLAESESDAKSTFTSACPDRIQDYPSLDLLLCLNSRDAMVCVIDCQLEPLIFSGDNVLVDGNNNQHSLPAECAVLDTSSLARNAAFYVLSDTETCGKVLEGIRLSPDDEVMSVVGGPAAEKEEVAQIA